MGPAEISLFLKSFATLFSRGDVSQMAERFATPLPFYAADSFFLVNSQKKLAESLARYRKLAAAQGVTRVELDNSYVEDSSRDRTMLVAWWNHCNDRGEVLYRNAIRYVLCAGEVAASAKIELVEYVVLASPKPVEYLTENQAM